MTDDDLTVGPAVSISTVTPASVTSRFAPGVIVGGRYRLVAMLGKGGMGEVYRADDLTLDHPVALKFLPEGVGLDPVRLAQFHNELRMARQVSHKNVCRLYDLGEADGRKFLTMEYVDGEDLATLLRRIGRLPSDKAIQIARQLCAGMAAAHERNVLHRDLKPANVMIDGDGNVRLTDFGLAAAAGDVEAVRAGTPQYMAPEQLSGQPASVKTDLYALGLILFEVFTGRRAYEAKTLNELQQQHQSGTVATPSSIVRDLDPAVERVILRCLERDPASRPSSAVSVALALPGGDPLAAALAAGETPSPEMVAAAGSTSALHPAIGLSVLAFVMAGLIVQAWLSHRLLLIARIPLDKSIDVLTDRAREIASELGYADRPVDWTRGLERQGDYLSYVARTNHQPSRWEALATTAAPTVRFWYRSSPRALKPISDQGIPTLNDPPPIITGMVSVVLDTRGRLGAFLAVPPQVESETTSQATSPADGSGGAPVAGVEGSGTEPARRANWPRVFDAAGLPMHEFQPVRPRWLPLHYADERVAWEGPLPDPSRTRVRVEAAAYGGRPVFFTIVGPWTRPTRMTEEPRTTRSRVLAGLTTSVIVILLAAVVALVRHNLRVGRGDRRGASRVALAMLAVLMAGWVVGGRHLLDPQVDIKDFFNHVAFALRNVGLLWLFYVGLEPYVRRHCPNMLIGWTRAIGGQHRDPLVGRDLLIGSAVGVLVIVLTFLLPLVGPLFGAVPSVPRGGSLEFLLGVRPAAAWLLAIVPSALTNTMVITFVFAVVRAVSKHVWVAALAAIVVFGVLVVGESGDSLVTGIVFAALFTGPMVWALVRFGLLSTSAAYFVCLVLLNAPTTLDTSKIYAGVGAWVMVVAGSVAALGFYLSRGGEPLLGKLIPND